MQWIKTLKDKFQCYDYIKETFNKANIDVSPYKEINYGIQFTTVIEGQKETIRVYESKKKGLNCDFSQVKSQEHVNKILSILDNSEEMPSTTNESCENVSKYGSSSSNLVLKPLIGTDESGKGDFFGPLVIAGVYADVQNQKILRALGVDDSKKLTDKKIASLADEIKKLCKHSIVVIGNEKYNELYDRIDNLNKLLAWGHARVIENLLNEVQCENVLSDQFGNPALIKGALMEKGQKINLEQRPRAEENVVVAAASILARNAFVENMDSMSKKYSIEFVKGASVRTIEIGKIFSKIYGKNRLNEVAKLHFKTLEKL